MADIFSMQSEIASEIATALRGTLTGREQGRIAKRPTDNLEAYESFLKGKYFLDRSNPDDLEKAKAAFEEAVSRDPNFALAHVGASACYGIEASAEYRNPAESWPKAREHAERAVALDDSLPEGHVALAAILLNRDWDWAAAENEFKRAMALGPVTIAGAEPNDLYAMNLAALGRLDEAVSSVMKAQKTDPLSPLLASDVAQIGYYARRYDDAIQEARRALELQPDSVFAKLTLGLSLVLQGKSEAGIASLESAVNLSGEASSQLAALGWALGRTGRASEAREIIRRLNSLSQTRYVAPLDLAMVEIGLGDADAAFRSLDRAVEERNAWLIFLNVEPMFDPIRADPRFAKLVARVGLPSSGKTP
jgi:tetratricopeptide (TPR) repeat protein